MVQVMEPSLNTPVADFYHGKSIFMTGGTGFIGKVLIAKLLYSCPGIENIFVLIRYKKNATPENRINSILKSSLFSKLQEEYPERLRKVVPILGNLSSDGSNIGISPQDESTILEKVSIVFHLAATIKFNEPISTAMTVNVEGTRKVIDLCKRMKNIEILVHCSTAFSNIDKNVIEEKIYPPPKTIDEVYDFIKVYGEDERQVDKLLGAHPNTYTFTKAIAENLVREMHGKVPTIIVRPSIVTPTYKEPLAGWVNNWNGATGYIYAVSLGVLHIIQGNGSLLADLIPVDFVANLLVVAAAKGKRTQEVAVYNSCSGVSNPITWRRFFELFTHESRQINNASLPCYCWFFSNRCLVRMLQVFLETIPIHLYSFVHTIRGKKCNLIKMLSVIRVQQNFLNYFTSQSWIMKTRKADELISSLSPEDNLQFLCDPKAIDYHLYMKIYVMGVQKYLMKSDKQSNKVEIV